MINPWLRDKSYKLYFREEKNIIYALYRPSLEKGKYIVNASLIKRTLLNPDPNISPKVLKSKVNSYVRRSNSILNAKLRQGTIPLLPLAPWIDDCKCSFGSFFNIFVKQFLIRTPHPCLPNSSIPNFQILALNARSLNKIKAQYIKAALSKSRYSPSVIAITELRTDEGLKYFQKTHTVLSSLPHPGRAGAALIIDRNLTLISSQTDIDDAVIATIEKQGGILICATVYLSDRLSNQNKKARLKIILTSISQQASEYVNPTIILFGDFNEYQQTTLKWLNENEQLMKINNLSLFEEYINPWNKLLNMKFDPLSTRIDSNFDNASRIDYIITNSSLKADTITWHDVDHAVFLLESPIAKAIKRKHIVYKRQEIVNNLKSLQNVNLWNLANFIKINLDHNSVPLPIDRISSSNEFNLEHPSNDLVKAWIKDFELFAHEISYLRFSEMQGFAFKIMRSVTKYDQFLKRDGSIIICLKDQNEFITETNLVSQKLIQFLQNRDDRLVESSVLPRRKKPNLYLYSIKKNSLQSH